MVLNQTMHFWESLLPPVLPILPLEKVFCYNGYFLNISLKQIPTLLIREFLNQVLKYFRKDFNFWDIEIS